jgi:hypothetical protein
VSCAICQKRREKRFCLALHDRICPQCCGEQREVTLDCPSECTYLQQARRQEGQRDLRSLPADEIFANVDISEHFLEEHQHLMLGISHTIAQAARGDRSLTDRDIIQALTILVRSYQTLLGSGLVYQETIANPVPQGLIDALQRSFAEFRELERKHLGYTALKDSDLLKMLVFVIRLALSHSSGRPRSRGFIDFLHAQFPAAPAVVETGGAGSLIVP